MDLQTELLDIEASGVVAPLREAGQYTAFSGLMPVVHLNRTEWIVRIQELAAVPGSVLRERVGSLDEHRNALERALNILIDRI